MEYFDYDEVQDFDVQRFLERSRTRERSRIEDELEAVHKELEEREEVHRSNVSEIESKLDWYINQLQDVYRRNGSREKVERLKREIRGFYEDLREERRNKWLDIRELRRERRELVRELDELSEDSGLSELLGD